MKNLLIVIASFLLVSSCNKNEQKTDKNNGDINVASDTNVFTEPDVEELNRMIVENDTVAYKKYYKRYITSGHSRDFLFYAVLMAEKNNYPMAYMDIANTLDFKLDDPLAYNSKYALYCMLKAYEMRVDGAEESINYIYTQKGKTIPKSSSIYDEN
ncbi:MAG: hypothetical protein K0M56_02285 [Kaistella sp.]|nr:hypothetical protein [Kaistella sp.]